MKIVKKNDQSEYKREKGRTVKHLLNFNTDVSFNSAAFYYGNSPEGSLETHLHKISHEIIFFPIGGSIIINDHLYNLEAWECVILEPGDIHGFEGNGKECIHFAIKFPADKDRIKV